jgi:glycosyltransferase involved in cell wall biosynthesis
MGIFEQSLALDERGWLGTMAVDAYCDLDSARYRWIPDGRVRRFLKKRYHPSLDAGRIRTRPLPSLLTRFGTKYSGDATGRDRWVFWHNAQFDGWVSRNLERFGNLAFGYESASLLAFRRARQLGVPRVLYQPVACAEVADELLGEERRRFPELADSLRYCGFPPEELQRRKEERELADAIVCASSFTRDSLIKVGVPKEKIVIEPYGVDQSVFTPGDEKFERFSVVWASSYTQTKGIGYLLEALAREPVPGIELVLAGYPYGVDVVARYEDRVRVRRLGHLPREQVARAMARCHAHVFPTLVEGFGRNIIEAMAAGLPVIATPNCAAPDLIENGVNGFIVPIRDVDAICERLAWIHDHPEEAAAMGRRARETVTRFTREDYRRRFSNRIQHVWEQRGAGASIS